MPRYEFKGGSSSKFWEVDLAGTALTTRFGRIGSEGQSATKRFGSPAAALKAYQSAIAEKVRKGYALVGTTPATPGGSGRATARGAARPAKSAANPALEKAIAKRPDDPAPYAAYGAWLSAQGDPRGEVITAAVALHKKPGDKALAKRARALRDAHKDALLGPLAPFVDDAELALQWRFGFIESAAVGNDEDGEIAGEQVVDALLRSPAGRFLRALTIRPWGTDEGTVSYARTLKTMARAGLPNTLRALTFDMGDYQLSWTALGDLGPLYAQLAGLEELVIAIGSLTLGRIALPALTRFELVTGGLRRANMAAIAAARWPALERLVVYFGTAHYGGECKRKDVEPLLRGTGLAKLRHLGLVNAEFADDLARLVCGSKLVAQLTSLDLSKGLMTDAGADALVAGAGALAHLAKIDVSSNWLSSGAQKKLKKAFGKRVHIGAQGDPDAEYRYVQVSE